MNNKVTYQDLLWTALTPAGTNLTRWAVALAVVMIMLVMPQGTLAQNKYKIETDGNCEVYYTDFNTLDNIFVTEAEAGKKLAIWLKEDAKADKGKYFTGEYTLNGISLGVASWGAFNDEFTMPAEAVSIVALQAQRKSVTLDLTTTTAQEIPAGAALQFNSDDRVTPFYEINGYDVDNSGVADLKYYDVGGEHTYVQRLEGADASGTITLAYSGPRDSYGTISFVFPQKTKTQVQSGWITVSGGPFTYTGQAIEPTVTVNDGTTDITGEFNVTYSNNKNAGEATVTVTANTASTSYTGLVSKTFTIDPRKVTISGVKAKDKVYDGTTEAGFDAGSATIKNKVGSDVLTVDVGSATAAFADANAGESKTVIFSGFALAGTSAGNYTPNAQPASVTATITPKAVTISSVKTKDKVYDGTATADIDAGSATFDGKVDGDVLTVDAKSVTAEFSDAEAGKDKPVTLSGSFSLAGTSAGNYTLSAQPQSATGTIAPKPVTVESGLTVSSTTLNEITEYSVDATNVKIVGAVNNEKLSIMGVIARLQNGSTDECDLDYTAATIVIGVDKANNYVVAEQGNQSTAPITASTETVIGDDGSTTETTQETVTGADGSKTETTTTTVTCADGTTTETTQETVTGADGSTTETTTETVRDAVGNVIETTENTTKEEGLITDPNSEEEDQETGEIFCEPTKEQKESIKEVVSGIGFAFAKNSVKTAKLKTQTSKKNALTGSKVKKLLVFKVSKNDSKFKLKGKKGKKVRLFLSKKLPKNVKVRYTKKAKKYGFKNKSRSRGSSTLDNETDPDDEYIESCDELIWLEDCDLTLTFDTSEEDIFVEKIEATDCIEGDANNDGYLNAADLVEMINAKDGRASERFSLTNADIDRDGQITQADIDAVVKYIIKQTDEE